MTRNLDIEIQDISQLNAQLLWRDYHHADRFEIVCEARPDKMSEQLEITNIHRNKLEQPCVYAIVINERLFRFGGSINGIKGRISSYNTGKRDYKGRNSRTNLWVLQSLLNINFPIAFFAHFPDLVRVDYFNKNVEMRPIPNPMDLKSFLISDFEKNYGVKPIGNVRR